jgi:hypothetical protein
MSTNKTFYFGSILANTRPPDWRMRYFVSARELLPPSKKTRIGKRNVLTRMTEEKERGSEKLIDKYRHSLARLMTSPFREHVTCDINYYMDGHLSYVREKLDDSLKPIFDDRHTNWMRKKGLKKARFCKAFEVPPMRTWNLGMVDKLGDPTFSKLVRFYSNYQIGPYESFHIRAAIDLFINPDKRIEASEIGYEIFCGYTDIVLAKSHNLPVKVIETYRLLYFDFSYMPKGSPATAMAYLTQIASLEHDPFCTKEEFNTYKSILELGDIALRARRSAASLSEAEKQVMAEYFKTSAIETLFKVKQSVSTMSDALKYLNTVINYQGMDVKAETVHYLRAKSENIQAVTKKLDSATVVSSSNSEEIDLYRRYLKDSSLVDAVIPNFRTVTQISQEKMN